MSWPPWQAAPLWEGIHDLDGGEPEDHTNTCACCSAEAQPDSALCADCYECPGCGLYASRRDGCEVCAPNESNQAMNAVVDELEDELYNEGEKHV